MDPLAVGAAAATTACMLLCVVAWQRRMSGDGAAAARLRTLHPVAPDEPGAPAALPLRRPRFTTPLLARFSGGERADERLAAALALAGIGLRPGEFLLMRVLAAAVGVVAALVITGGGVVALLVAASLAIAGWFAPIAYLRWRTARRLRLIERQLIDLLALLAGSVRAGFSLMQALDGAARRVGPPLEHEVERVLGDVRLGQSTDDALRAWAVRLPSADVRLLVTATIVQRAAGGNVAEVLDQLARTMRERVELRRQVSALTAYPRMAARMIALYPIAMTVLLTLLSPGVYGRLWTQPAGWALLAVALALNVIAFVVMRRIARVDE